MTGYGTGSLNLTPDGQSALETSVSMAMSAVGTRGELIGSRATGGFALASFTGPQTALSACRRPVLVGR